MDHVDNAKCSTTDSFLKGESLQDLAGTALNAVLAQQASSPALILLLAWLAWLTWRQTQTITTLRGEVSSVTGRVAVLEERPTPKRRPKRRPQT